MEGACGASSSSSLSLAGGFQPTQGTALFLVPGLGWGGGCPADGLTDGGTGGLQDPGSSSELPAGGGVGAGGDESNYLFGAASETPRKLVADGDKMKINSAWHAVCAVCVPGAVHRRRSLASDFLEVLTSDFFFFFE